MFLTVSAVNFAGGGGPNCFQTLPLQLGRRVSGTPGHSKADLMDFFNPEAQSKIHDFRPLPKLTQQVQTSTQGWPRTDLSLVLTPFWCYLSFLTFIFNAFPKKANTFEDGVRAITNQGVRPPKTINLCFLMTSLA